MLLIKNGLLVNPANGCEEVCDILIRNGVFEKIGKRIPAGKSKVIDARGKLVFPGLIDAHCHLREPGREDEETIETGSRAAARGGFTTVCCMPNTEPALDSKVAIRYVRDRANQAACEVLPIGAITLNREGKALAPYGEMTQEGAVGFSDDGNCVMDALVMRRALEYTKLFGKPVIAHAEDQNLIKNGVMNEGFLSMRLGLTGIPRQAEQTMVARDIVLAELTGGRLHLAHLTTAEAVALVRHAKKELSTVTCEAAIHHLILTEDAVEGYNTNAKVSPPLRTARDIEALVRGLKDGTIDCIVTDHAPHSDEEKESGLENAPFGIIGFETALPLALSLREKGLSLPDIIGKMTIGPARTFGLDRGNVAEGKRGDLVVCDPDRKWIVRKEDIVSRSQNSPFIGRALKGDVLCTISAGVVTYQQR